VASVCRSEGRPCALATDCCSAVCAPSLTGKLACRSSCAPTGAPCTGGADCCAGSCGGFPARCLPAP
jgi:hypothetical protein